MDIGNTLPENNSEFTPEKLLPQKEGSQSSNHPFAESLFVLGSVWDFVFFGEGGRGGGCCVSLFKFFAYC